MEQKITTHLWFDKEARQAAEFYVSVFPQLHGGMGNSGNWGYQLTRG